MCKKDNNLNRGQVLAQEPRLRASATRGVYSRRLCEQSPLCVYYLLSHLPPVFVVFVCHSQHVRFYRSVTIDGPRQRADFTAA